MLNAVAGRNRMDSTRSPVVSPARALTLPKGSDAVMMYRTMYPVCHRNEVPKAGPATLSR